MTCAVGMPSDPRDAEIARLRAQITEYQQRPGVRDVIHREIIALRQVCDLEAEVRRLKEELRARG